MSVVDDLQQHQAKVYHYFKSKIIVFSLQDVNILRSNHKMLNYTIMQKIFAAEFFEYRGGWQINSNANFVLDSLSTPFEQLELLLKMHISEKFIVYYHKLL